VVKNVASNDKMLSREAPPVIMVKTQISRPLVLWDADAGSRGSEHLDASVGMWRTPAWALGPPSAVAARVGADHGRVCGHRGERECGGLRGHSAAALVLAWESTEG
jgi:hypothetical protein